MIKKLLFCFCASLCVNSYASANLNIYVPEIKTYKGENTKIPARISFDIINSTTSYQHYEVHYSICPQNKDCFRDKFQVNVNPGKREAGDKDVWAYFVYNRPGKYTTVVHAKVEGESSVYKESKGDLLVYAK